MKDLKIIIILSLSLLFQSCFTNEYREYFETNEIVGSQILDLNSALVTDSSILVSLNLKIANRPGPTKMIFELPLDNIDHVLKYSYKEYSRDIGDSNFNITEQIFLIELDEISSIVEDKAGSKRIKTYERKQDDLIIYISKENPVQELDGKNFINAISTGALATEFLTWHSLIGNSSVNLTTISYYMIVDNKIIINNYLIKLPWTTKEKFTFQLRFIPLYLVMDLMFIIGKILTL